MKILSVIASMDPATGGTSQGVRTTIAEQKKIGAYNEIVSLDDPNASFLKQMDCKITALGPGKTPWCYSKLLQPWLSNNLRRFDAVIIQGLWLYPSYAANRAVSKFNAALSGNRKVKLFVMPHGMLDPYFQKASSRRLKAIRNYYYWRLIENNVIADADALLFTCKTEMQLARTTFSPYEPKGEIVVGYGIEDPSEEILKLSVLDSDWYRSLENRPYLLFLSRIHEKKGVDLLIEAYRQLYQKYVSSNVQLFDKPFPALVIAGPGLDTEYGNMILNKVKGAELSQQVLFSGMLTGPDKWNAYKNCDAFVLPSHQENFGIAVVEALACGKPVLISDQVNIYQEINEAEAGIIGTDNLTGTIEIIEKWLLLSEYSKCEMANNARKSFENRFTITLAAKNILAALN